jgi:hypothetical protein
LEADFINVPREIMPAGHGFAGTAGIDDFAHGAKMRRRRGHRNAKMGGEGFLGCETEFFQVRIWVAICQQTTGQARMAPTA